MFFFGYYSASRSKDLLLFSFWYRWCLQCLLFVVVVVGWIWKKDHWTITKWEEREKNNMLVAGMFIHGQFFSDLTIRHNHFKIRYMQNIQFFFYHYMDIVLFFFIVNILSLISKLKFLSLSFTVWFSLCFSLSLSLWIFVFLNAQCSKICFTF